MKREQIIELPKIIDQRGSLSFAEVKQHIPFNVSRVSLITEKKDLGKGEILFIALSGSADVITNKKQSLNQPHKALYIPEPVQRNLENLSADAICLILSAETDSKEPETQDSLSKKYTISDCSSLIKLSGSSTNLSEIENIPFDTKRVFYIYDIPMGERRGFHAHKSCHEILIAASGSFEVELDDGTDKKTVTLNNPAYGLHIPPGIWAVEKSYSPDVICLVLASDEYDPNNYINAYSDFIKYRQDGN